MKINFNYINEEYIFKLINKLIKQQTAKNNFLKYSKIQLLTFPVLECLK
jgi:hypothetical protein